MITSVVGKCNSIDIIFNNIGGDKWTTTFPANIHGGYIIELWATNDYGNTSYFATIRFTYDPTTLTMTFTILNVGADFTINEVGSLFGLKDVELNTEITMVNASYSIESVDTKFKKGE